MKDNIIKKESTFYNLDAIVGYRIWPGYIELIYPGNVFVRIEEPGGIKKIKLYFDISDEKSI